MFPSFKLTIYAWVLKDNFECFAASIYKTLHLCWHFFTIKELSQVGRDPKSWLRYNFTHNDKIILVSVNLDK